jgi:N-acetylmuramoyl-L-alanine amidase
MTRNEIINAIWQEFPKTVIGMGVVVYASLILLATQFGIVIRDANEARIARNELIASYDLDKQEEWDKAVKAENDASTLIQWAKDCRSANIKGTVLPANSCDVIQNEPSDAGEKEPVAKVEPSNIDMGDGKLFLFYGHGKNDSEKFTDNGATASDGTTERALIMGIGDTVKNYVNPDVIVGRTPHSLKSNLSFAQNEANEVGCWLTSCYMLSIHADKSTELDKRGAVAYYNEYLDASRLFAEALVSCYGGRAVPDINNRLGRLAAVRDVGGVGGVLLETGNMANEEDLKFLKNGAGSKLAKCLKKMFKSESK